LKIAIVCAGDGTNHASASEGVTWNSPGRGGGGGNDRLRMGVYDNQSASLSGVGGDFLLGTPSTTPLNGPAQSPLSPHASWHLNKDWRPSAPFDSSAKMPG